MQNKFQENIKRETAKGKLKLVMYSVSKISWITTIFLLVIFLCCESAQYFRHLENKNLYEYAPTTPFNDTRLLNVITKQRNYLSNLLNLNKKRLGQLECESNHDKAFKTSRTGGWCQNASATQHVTDHRLVNALTEFFKGKHVGSFGDGPGHYKKKILNSGKVKSFDAYDGAPYCEKSSGGIVSFLDLSIPQYGIPVYDWILSLEVAEHIPQEFENIFIDNIVRHAREGIVLSWATPGQEGYSHVNNRPFEYVRTLMNSLRFLHDTIASEILKRIATNVNLRRNVNVFRRKEKWVESETSFA